MAEFLPFEGTRYNGAMVRLADVVAPPYDVISPEEREALYAKDPHNVIRLILNHDTDPYASAAKHLAAWKQEGVLERDDARMYVYYQTFRTPDGSSVTRSGVIGRLKLSAYGAGEVQPHERTLPGPKADRFKLFESTRANLSPIFGLIDDATMLFDQTIELATIGAPIADVDEKLASGESVRHVVWPLTDTAALARVTAIVARGPVTIADGHHRYETALAFRDAHPELEGAKYMMVFLANLRSEGMVILPTHRVLHSVAGFDWVTFLEKLRDTFTIEPLGEQSSIQTLAQAPDALCVLELPEVDVRWLVRDQERTDRSPLEALAVWRLQEEVLKPFAGLTQAMIDARSNLEYPHTEQELHELRTSGRMQAAFVLRPVSPDELLAVVSSHEFMPQKSTFFYPKLLSGLVFHEFEGQPSA